MALSRTVTAHDTSPAGRGNRAATLAQVTREKAATAALARTGVTISRPLGLRCPPAQTTALDKVSNERAVRETIQEIS